MAKVLLAEDDETMVALLTTLLRMDGYEVSSVDLDQDIATAVREVRPDFLVLDVHLAQKNGLDVLKELRNGNSASRPRIIMISGLNMKLEALRLGADDFLLKPFMPDELTRLLKNSVRAQS